MRKGFLLGVVVILTAVGAGLAENQIRLKSRQFVPEKRISAETNGRIQAATGGKAHVLIQLDRKMKKNGKCSAFFLEDWDRCGIMGESCNESL